MAAQPLRVWTGGSLGTSAILEATTLSSTSQHCHWHNSKMTNRRFRSRIVCPQLFPFRSILDFLRLGVQTNWWGLGCPSHCGHPSFTSLAFSFLAGSWIWLLPWIWCPVASWPGALALSFVGSSIPGTTSAPRASPGASPGLQRIQAYLHE